MRVIGTLAALAAVAFVVGAGAGLVWKQPGLLFADWTGGTEEVAWSDAPTEAPAATALAAGAGASYETASAAPARPAGDALADVAAAPAAAPPAAAPEAKPAPAAPAAKAPPRVARATTPPVAAPPPSGVAVQVGAFGERSAADALVSRLRGAGFPAYAVAPDGGAWRVRVGPFPDRARAEKSAARLQQEQKLPTWILAEGR